MQHSTSTKDMGLGGNTFSIPYGAYGGLIQYWHWQYIFGCFIRCKVDIFRPFYYSNPFYRIARQNHSIKALTVVWLLPAVTPIVPATTGALLAHTILPHSTSHAILTLLASMVLLFLGLSLTFMILPLYVLRLITEGLPKNTLIASKLLPVGPCGQVCSIWHFG
jgi:tellurite resistance protein TehA-like permease